MASSAQTFTADQVCQIISGEDGELDYMFPGSDDELDALELDEPYNEDTLTDHVDGVEPMGLEGEMELDSAGSNSSLVCKANDLHSKCSVTSVGLESSRIFQAHKSTLLYIPIYQCKS